MNSTTTEDATLIRKRHEGYVVRARELADALVDDALMPGSVFHQFEIALDDLETWFEKEHTVPTTTAAAPEFDKITGERTAIKAAPLLPGTYNDSTGLGDGDSFVQIEPVIQDDRNGFEGDSAMHYDTTVPVPRPTPGQPAAGDDTGFE
jgi:hypothetical protein